MGRIKARDTRPEMIVRRLIWKMGRRYRLHDGKLPGRPDLVFRKTKQVVFINGCYWHRHDCKAGRSVPKTRVEFWSNKFAENVKRDARDRDLLLKMGWSFLNVWECELKSLDVLESKLNQFFSVSSNFR